MTAWTPSTRILLASALRAMALAWRSAPGWLLGFTAVTAAGAATPVAVAWLTKLSVDGLVEGARLTDVLGPAVGLALAGLVTAVLPELGTYQRAEIDRHVGLRAQDELFAAVGRFAGLARFEDPVFLDRLRLAQQSVSSPGQLAEAMFGLGRGALMLLGLLGTLAVISPLFTVIVLAAAVPTLVVELRLSRQRAAMLWEIGPWERWELFYGQLLSGVEAAKEVRLFNLGGFLRGRMAAQHRLANAARRRLDRHELTRQSTLALLSAVVSGAGLVWVIVTVARGRLTVGDVALFIASIAGVQGSLDGLVRSTAVAHQLLLMFSHYVVVVRAEPDLPVSAQPTRLPALRRGIEFRDVWFRYSERYPWVLSGVNLFIPAGTTVALVGRNGSGKSTIVKLLCRFYDPCRGAILWDGVDLRDVSVPGLRERIGAVFQDFMSYDFTAEDNIAVGDLSALGDSGRIGRAARHAGLHDDLAALPNGYGTLLTRMFVSESDKEDQQTGVVLSGGQWQRLALARAFLRQDRDLLILDEPSAGLDAEAEYEVHAQVREIRANRTGLLISHRLGAIRDADLIVVLADGIVVEQGGHTDLLASCGLYARLFNLQAAGYARDNVDSETSGDRR